MVSPPVDKRDKRPVQELLSRNSDGVIISVVLSLYGMDVKPARFMRLYRAGGGVNSAMINTATPNPIPAAVRTTVVLMIPAPGFLTAVTGYGMRHVAEPNGADDQGARLRALRTSGATSGTLPRCAR